MRVRLELELVFFLFAAYLARTSKAARTARVFATRLQARQAINCRLRTGHILTGQGLFPSFTWLT